MRVRWSSLGGLFAAAVGTAVVIVVTQVYTPYFLAVAAPLLIAWITVIQRRHLRTAKRLAEGRCRCCGYDLTGNLSGVCPECGEARS